MTITHMEQQVPRSKFIEIGKKYKVRNGFYGNISTENTCGKLVQGDIIKITKYQEAIRGQVECIVSFEVEGSNGIYQLTGGTLYCRDLLDLEKFEEIMQTSS